MFSCRKCEKPANRNVCEDCFTRTCLGCGRDKSPHAQLCPWCLKGDYVYDEKDEKDEDLSLMGLVASVLKLAKIKQHYIDRLLTHKKEYEMVFTPKSHNMNENYEVFEFAGDGIINSFIPYYFLRRFPILNCTFGVKILGRLKINYVSKRSFSKISENLGFLNFIKATEEQKQNSTIVTNLLEDVLEAFIGATVKILDEEFTIGVGYGIAYRILETLFDRINISLEYEDIYDPKSRLKEVFEAARGSLGTLLYVDEFNSTKVYRTLNGQKILLGEGANLATRTDRQQEAAKQAIKLFRDEEDARRRLHNQIFVSCAAIKNR